MTKARDLADGTFSGDVTVSGNITSTGIDDNATSTAMTLDSSGNLLVGTTDSSVYNNGTDTSADTGINLNTTYAGFARYNGTPVYINRTGSNGDIVTFNKSGAAVGSIGSYAGNQTYITSLGGGMKFNWYSGTQAAIEPCSTSGVPADNLHDLGGASARWQDLYLSGGVYLGGTGSANLLDDYEEGTFTPAFVNGSFSGGAALGYYVKVGDLVFVAGKIDWTSKSGSGGLEVTNLPFTPYSGIAAARGAISLGTLTGIDNNGNRQLIIGMDGNINKLFIRMINDNASWSAVQVQNCSSTGEVQFSGTYRA